PEPCGHGHDAPHLQPADAHRAVGGHHGAVGALVETDAPAVLAILEERLGLRPGHGGEGVHVLPALPAEADPGLALHGAPPGGAGARDPDVLQFHGLLYGRRRETIYAPGRAPEGVPTPPERR